MGRGTSGGGRSSGGHSSSSSRSSGGRMGGTGRGSSGGGPSGGFGRSGAGRPGAGRPGNFSGGFGHGAPPPPNPYRGGVYGSPRPPRRSGCMGCASYAIIILVIIILVISSLGVTVTSLASSSGITKSTIKREKLDAQYTQSTNFYVDELGWIRNSTTLNSGLKAFYNKTGVHPLLYITDTVNGTKSPDSSDMEEYANALYDELCPDEGHILLLFRCLDESTDYNMWYVCGTQAKIVMDDEACDILMDYIDSYFYSDKSDEEMFADAFEDAAKRIMSKTTSPIIYVSICAAAVILAAIALVWWTKYKEQKNLEAKQTADILNADIHTMADDSIKDLEDKYKD